MPALPFRVKAVFDYSSPHDDDLNFMSGQIITVTEEEDSEWYSGAYTDASGVRKEGIFPRNFVERYEPATPPRPTKANRVNQEPATSSAASRTSSGDDTGAYDDGASRHVEPTLSASLVNQQHSESGKDPQQSIPAGTTMVDSSDTVTIGSMNELLTTTSAPTAARLSKEISLVAEKPSSGSFKDRIAAFNKPTAPPITPFKSPNLGSFNGSDFIKKRFIAPPPSKDAFVPPLQDQMYQKPHQKDDDLNAGVVISPELEDAGSGEKTISASVAPKQDGNENEPKPASLKDRIALLQKQQLEQATRHAEATQKKDKEKRSLHGGESQNIPQLVGTILEPGLNQKSSKTEEPVIDYPEEGSRTVIRSSRDNAREYKSPTKQFTESKDLPSDSDDAKSSVAASATKGPEDVPTSIDNDDDNHRAKTASSSTRSTAPLPLESDDGVKGFTSDEEVDQVEEEQVDPAVKRRMEIRERMAKMSGGMGMHGMFGPQAGIGPTSSGTLHKQKSDISMVIASTSSHGPDATGSPYSGPGTSTKSLQPLPGMQRVQTPDSSDRPVLVGDNVEGTSPSDVEFAHTEENLHRDESDSGSNASSERPEDIPPAPTAPQELPMPLTALPSTQGTVSSPTGSQPVLLSPLTVPMARNPGSEFDEEMPLSQMAPPSLPLKDQKDDTGLQQAAPRAPSGVPVIPEGPAAPHSPHALSTKSTKHSSIGESPTSSGFAQVHHRSSRAPPIPSSSPMASPPSMTRPPPPPPPHAEQQSRTSTAGSITESDGTESTVQGSEDGEVSQFEGGYHIDMTPVAGLENATRTQAKDSKNGYSNDSATRNRDSNSLYPTHPVAPNLTPRGVPPPLPNQPPKSGRHSMDMPRVAPPPVPPPKNMATEAVPDVGDISQHSPRPTDTSNIPSITSHASVPARASKERSDNEYLTSHPRLPLQQPPPLPPQQAPPPPFHFQHPGVVDTLSLQTPSPRQSLEVQRTQPFTRKSTDQPRSSSEHCYLAAHVNLGLDTQWWVQPNMPPPVFQQRQDLIFEVEESTSSKRGGKIIVTRDVYVLFADYSQTIVTARFDPRDIADIAIEQRHEPPPPRPRQDQLEEAHRNLGQYVAEGAASKQNATVRDGAPHSLVLELLDSLPSALRPVGTRGYGALVYANIANASIQQYDEIRAGDIISLRNARFQGHRGSMHQKYTAEVGKPEHVGVVVDWDGTKKKVRAWEQGRESKKVKMESFKVGDLRSGEVKIWRVMPRSWIMWEGQN